MSKHIKELNIIEQLVCPRLLKVIRMSIDEAYANNNQVFNSSEFHDYKCDAHLRGMSRYIHLTVVLTHNIKKYCPSYKVGKIGKNNSGNAYFQVWNDKFVMTVDRVTSPRSLPKNTEYRKLYNMEGQINFLNVHDFGTYQVGEVKKHFTLTHGGNIGAEFIMLGYQNPETLKWDKQIDLRKFDFSDIELDDYKSGLDIRLREDIEVNNREEAEELYIALK